MSDLDKLIEAVEAGGWPDLQTEVAAFYSGGSIAHCNECAGLARQANAGSLDAAMRLHEAVLPGHTRAVDATAPEMGIRVEVWSPEGPITGVGDNASEARAWLLAILKAVRAQATP